MCGRFTQNFTWAEIHAYYSLFQAPLNLEPNYNVCPTDSVGVVVPHLDQRQFMGMRWGIIPRWWKLPKKEWKSATFNARAETVRTLKTFNGPFRDKRCLIPAGIWDAWYDKEANEDVNSCAMVITKPNKFVAEVHDRMPVILEPESFETWMRTTDVEEAASLLKPPDESVLLKRPVSKRVNSSRTAGDDATLVEEVRLAAG